jgi:hypothetical protein
MDSARPTSLLIEAPAVSGLDEDPVRLLPGSNARALTDQAPGRNGHEGYDGGLFRIIPQAAR